MEQHEAGMKGGHIFSGFPSALVTHCPGKQRVSIYCAMLPMKGTIGKWQGHGAQGVSATHTCRQPPASCKWSGSPGWNHLLGTSAWSSRCSAETLLHASWSTASVKAKPQVFSRLASPLQRHLETEVYWLLYCDSSHASFTVKVKIPVATSPGVCEPPELRNWVGPAWSRTGVQWNDLKMESMQL